MSGKSTFGSRFDGKEGKNASAEPSIAAHEEQHQGKDPQTNQALDEFAPKLETLTSKNSSVKGP
jgi:hypothetical protein